MDYCDIHQTLESLEFGADMMISKKIGKDLKEKIGKFKGGLECIGYIDKKGNFTEDADLGIHLCYQFFFTEYGKRGVTIEQTNTIHELKII